MAVTQNSYTGDNSTTNYSFTFPYLKTSDIKCSLDAVVTTAFSLANATTVQFNTAPGSGVKIKIYRETADDSLTATFYAGSSIKSEDLNDNFTQNLYTTQEVNARFLSNLGGTMVGNLTMGEDADIIFEGATANAHETTLTVEDPTADRTITFPNNTGTVVTTGSTLAVSTGMIADDAITSAKLDTNIDIAGTLDVTGNTKLDANLDVTGTLDVNSAVNIAGATGIDGNFDINTNKFTVSATSGNTTIAGTLGVTGSSSFTNAITGLNGAVIDNIYIGISSDSEIDTSSGNLTLDSAGGTVVVDDNLSVNGSTSANAVTATSFSGPLTGNVTGNVTGALTGNADTATAFATGRTLASTGDVVWNSGTFDGTANKTAAATIQNDAVTYAKMQNVSATSKVLGRISSGAGVVEELSAANIKTIYESNAETNAYIDSHNTLIGGITSTASEINKLDGYTGTATNLNIVSGMSKVVSTDSFPTTSDTAYPTAKSINTHVVSLIQDIGGFYPIDNEVSFPTTNPDPGDDAGTIVSIANAGGLKVADGSGSGDYAGTAGHSIGATTSGGTAVTITDIDATLRGTTIADGKGMLVQTTSTLNTYTYHRLVVDEAGVANAQTLVSDFNERYRVNAGEPSSHLTDGDLVFDTNANKMKVYDSDASAWKEVTSSGDFKLLTVVPDGATSGSPVFNGSNVSYDLRDGSNAASISNVGQLIVSLNGVIQKPNSGSWSASNEGFHLEGTNGIKFCTAPAADSSLFVTQIGTTVTLNHPAADSVVADSIDDGAISNIAISGTAAIEGSKLDNPLQFPDSHKVSFGTTGTGDLEIYHASGNSYISDQGAGDLYIQASDKIVFQKGDGSDTLAEFNRDTTGGCELYYDNKKTFETFVNGVIVRGGDDTEDGEIHLYADRGDDNPDKWRIAANASASRLRIQNYHDGAWETNIEANSNEGVKLDYNNLTTFETRSDGIKITGVNNSYAVIEFNADNGDDNADKWLQYAGSDGAMYWQNYSSSSWVNKVNITSAGDVGIGSTSPYDSSWGTEGNTKHLHIKGTTYGVLSLEGDNTANTKWSMGAGDGRFYMAYNENDQVHVLDAVRSTRDVEVLAGHLVMKAAGKGIDFTGGSSVGTANNILDDYEEGTFTPTIISDGGTNPTQSYAYRYAYFTKIGNIVHCKVDISFASSGISGGTGGAFIDDLPFPTGNAAHSYGTTFSSGYATNWGSNNYPTAGYASLGNSKLYLMSNYRDDGDTYTQCSGITNSTRLICAFTYMVD